jgi:hypothetical protein
MKRPRDVCAVHGDSRLPSLGAGRQLHGHEHVASARELAEQLRHREPIQPHFAGIHPSDGLQQKRGCFILPHETLRADQKTLDTRFGVVTVGEDNHPALLGQGDELRRKIAIAPIDVDERHVWLRRCQPRRRIVDELILADHVHARFLVDQNANARTCEAVVCEQHKANHPIVTLLPRVHRSWRSIGGCR